MTDGHSGSSSIAQQIERRILLLPKSARADEVRKICKELQDSKAADHDVKYAFMVAKFSDMFGGDTVTDYSINVNNSNLNATSLGHNSAFTADDIKIYNSAVEESTIDDAFSKALKEVRAEVENAPLKEAELAAVKFQLGQLTDEAAKSEPSSSLIKMFFGGLSTFAASVPAVEKLGKLIGEYYPG